MLLEFTRTDHSTIPNIRWRSKIKGNWIWTSIGRKRRVTFLWGLTWWNAKWVISSKIILAPREQRTEVEGDSAYRDRMWSSIRLYTASRHWRLGQSSKIDYSSITLRLVPFPSFLSFCSIVLLCCSPHSIPSWSWVPPLGPMSLLSFSHAFWTSFLSCVPSSRFISSWSRLHVVCPNDVSDSNEYHRASNESLFFTFQC